MEQALDIRTTDILNEGYKNFKVLPAEQGQPRKVKLRDTSLAGIKAYLSKVQKKVVTNVEEKEVRKETSYSLEKQAAVLKDGTSLLTGRMTTVASGKGLKVKATVRDGYRAIGNKILSMEEVKNRHEVETPIQVNPPKEMEPNENKVVSFPSVVSTPVEEARLVNPVQEEGTIETPPVTKMPTITPTIPSVESTSSMELEEPVIPTIAPIHANVETEKKLDEVSAILREPKMEGKGTEEMKDSVPVVPVVNEVPAQEAKPVQESVGEETAFDLANADQRYQEVMKLQKETLELKSQALKKAEEEERLQKEAAKVLQEKAEAEKEAAKELAEKERKEKQYVQAIKEQAMILEKRKDEMLKVIAEKEAEAERVKELIDKAREETKQTKENTDQLKQANASYDKKIRALTLVNYDTNATVISKDTSREAVSRSSEDAPVMRKVA